MDGLRPFRIVESASAALRLDAAVAFLKRFPPDQPITLVAATRGAADDLARRVAVTRGATLGMARYSLTQIAARLAATRLAGQGIAPSTALGSEAVAARAAFDVTRDGTLTYLKDVVDAPGFPRALARTIAELRVAGVAAAALAHAGDAGPDLALLLRRSEGEFDASATADRARLFATAAEAVDAEPTLAAPLLLLDVPIESPVEERFVAALAAAATEVCATVPAHDASARDALTRAGGSVEPGLEPSLYDSVAADANDLDNLRMFLFSDAAPPDRELDGSLQFFSAPGEGRECVEIARRILAEARAGVRFDEMAILVRAPQHYQGLIEHALERAQVPAWFDRGTRRPHPAGRAFLAVLACAAEGLSATRFAEYLSLGELPPPGREQTQWAPSLDDVFPGPVREEHEDDVADDETGTGTLPAPRRWERLLVDSAVIGGDPARWARRLDGLAAEFAARLAEACREDPASSRATGLERDLVRLGQLRAFALPLVSDMAAWPAAAPWGEWLDRLQQMAPRVLRMPTYVLRVLADLRPMASVGPVGLDEVRSVLAERLLMVDAEPPARRYGRVFVASPAQARGRAFRVVFLPGLAERMFPQKPRQDPLLLDGARARLHDRLPTRVERSRLERLLLHLAAGAATERLYVSYPRIDVGEARARVPSFYALDVLRGATGRIPDHETLAEAAAQVGDPTLAWPAPAQPGAAIDDQEHDLAVLRALLDAKDPSLVRGHAQYILRLNAALRRSVTERWGRAERKWSHFDGLTRVVDGTRAALDRHRLAARSYSLTALQRFAACPYQFLLSAIYRLETADQSHPLQRLDPLTKGSIVHRMQAVFFGEMQRRGGLPVTEDAVDAALVTLAASVERVADEYREKLVPAIDRVWRDEIAAIARDLRGWVRQIAREGHAWTPRYFELAFGLPMDDQRDPRSVPKPVQIEGRFTLRGSVDLVEEGAGGSELRVTDHKTGKNRTTPALVIGGGSVLQPVLYSLVVEQITRRPVVESRLSFCTTAGGFSEKVVPLTPENRRCGIEALEIIDRALEVGMLAAAPAEGACTWCDFRPVCGPNEEERVERKPKDRLRDLAELRSRP